jgi:hypothetical protein
LKAKEEEIMKQNDKSRWSLIVLLVFATSLPVWLATFLPRTTNWLPFTIPFNVVLYGSIALMVVWSLLRRRLEKKQEPK